MTDSFARLKELSPGQRDLLLRRLSQFDARRPAAGGLVRRARPEDVPLSFAQERQWFLDRLSPGDPAFNIIGGLRLSGRLSLPALQAALDEIMRRHEPLRANFTAPAGAPVQIVRPPSACLIEQTDLSGLDERAREEAIDRHYAAEAVRGFDLACDALLRITLLRLSEREHFLTFAFHHIASDGWSIGILLEELAQLYAAQVEGRAAMLPEPPVSYGDFATWQRQRMKDGALEQGLAYWRNQLADPPPVLELPPDRLAHSGAARGERDLTGASRLRLIDRTFKAELDALSRGEDCTLFATLLTGFMVLLMRCTGQDDILIGSPVSGRIRVETERLIGLFLNTLALRAKLSPEMTFAEAMAEVRRSVLDGLTHHEAPFERVVQEIAPDRSSNSHPLFETFFNFTPSPPRALDLPDLTARFQAPTGERSEFSLVLYVTEWEGTLELKAHYQQARYSEARIDAFLDQLAAVLRQAVADPGVTLGALDLTTEASRAALPDPAQPLDAPEHVSVPAAIADWAAQTPGAPALVQGDATLSYAQFGAAVDALAQSLRARGLAPGDVAAVHGPRCAGFIVAMAAVLRAGGVLLNLSPDLPADRRRQMLERAGARVMIQAGPAGKDNGWLSGLADVTRIEIDPDGAAPEGEAPAPLPAPEPYAAHAPAYLFFTSGSTGTPKAVLGSHAGLAHFLAWQRETFGVGPGERCAQLTGASFDVVLRDVFLPLTSGAALVLPPAELSSADPAIVPWLAGAGATSLHAVPSVAEAWLADRKPGAPLAALRRVFFAGEPLTAALVQRWRARLSPDAEIVNLYGPTETTLAKCFYRAPEEPRAGIQPLGRPLPQTQALVLTPGRKLCGIGEPGEIAIRTPFRSFGYLDMPEETARRFVRNPFRDDPADAIYLTGDRGAYRADGTLEFLGRLDHQIKLHGVRIEPEEIGAALRAAPDVASAVVVARQDAPGDPVLVAYVVPQPGAERSPRRLREFLRHSLPAPMIPSAFVFLDALPLTANQKVDRSRLPAPDQADTGQDGAVAAPPRDVTELRMTQIWEALLERRPIGVTDNFFDIGGHSLLTLRLLVKIEQEMGVKLPLAALFEGPTIEHLAEVARRQERAHPQLAPLWSAEGEQALFLIHTGGGMILNYVPFVRRLAPSMPVYGVQAQGLDGQTEPLSDIAEIAASYVALIRERQPHGPYLLAGHSMGGLIAHDMARQLEAAGETVSLLVLFDTVLHRGAEDDAPGEETDARTLAAAAATIGRFVGKDVDLPAEMLLPLSHEDRIDRVLAALADAGALGLDGAEGMVRNLLSVSRAHVAARRAWRPGACAAPVTLFRASEGAPTDDASLGWSAACGAPVRVVAAAGDHMTMMSEPHAAGLADSFRALLNEILPA